MRLRTLAGHFHRSHIHQLCGLLLLLCALGCDPAPEPALDVRAVTIEMTGSKFKWSSRYAGNDGQLGTNDDVQAAQVLHVPVNADIEIRLKSLDYIYTLEVPQASEKQIAVPDLTFTIQFKADKIGTFTMPGDQLCGFAHPDLMGTLVVDSQADYARWLGTQQLSSQGK